ncbi:MAG: MFS transporter, partial [Clostridia bacterium]|nr:MFS transporter [Clostridia bacterium]
MAEINENGTFESAQLNQAYMNRLFCSTRERVAFTLKAAFGKMDLGKYDTGSEIFLYKFFGLSAYNYGKAAAGLGVYDLINDPLSAAIIDNMRSRWGKFKPFQYL